MMVDYLLGDYIYIYIYIVEIDKNTWFCLATFCQWPFQEPIDWRYLPYIRHFFKAYLREYTPKTWPNIWYSTSILGSWRSPIDRWWLIICWGFNQHLEVFETLFHHQIWMMISLVNDGWWLRMGWFYCPIFVGGYHIPWTGKSAVTHW